jgi:hypothetical protein
VGSGKLVREDRRIKILIVGVPKSGTTILVHRVAGGFPGCHAITGGEPQTVDNSDKTHFVQKFTYMEEKNRGEGAMHEHLARSAYDRKIWIARDPRDIAVSDLLFRWFRGHKKNPRGYRAFISLLSRKESDPGSVAFHELFRHFGHILEPLTNEQLVERERRSYLSVSSFVAGFDDDWFMFKYEDMIAGLYSDLNRFLGFDVALDASVLEVQEQVVRRRASGDWRDWFTTEDVEMFKPVYDPYLRQVGYDPEDWCLNPNQEIDPHYSSEYVKSLPAKLLKQSGGGRKNRILRLLGRA